MSWRASAWALDDVMGIGANCKLVLLALCEFANDENETWRSQVEIAKRAECEVRTVKTHLKSLEGWGLISRRARYRWCDSADPACASRPSHKHRSGTTYVVHVEHGSFDLAAFKAANELLEDKPKPVRAHRANANNKPVENTETNNATVDKSTGANLALVEETAASSQKVHRGKICTYEDEPGSTGANSRSPQVQELAPIRSYNPHINLQPTNHPSDRRVSSEPAFRMVGGDGQTPEDEAMLVRACLPAAWQELAVGTAFSAVVRLLREGLRSGWRPEQIEHTLAQSPSLDGASNPAGLMIYRIRTLLEGHPPLSRAELRRQRQAARENELAALLAEIAGRDASTNPEGDWVRLTSINPFGLSKPTQDALEQTLELVRKRREHWQELKLVSR